MKIKFFLLSMFFFTLFCSCKKEVYYPGVVIVRANNDFQNGVIKSLDVYESDMDIENLGRAIVFRLEKDKPALDLHDTVFYKIKNVDGITIAHDVHKNEFYCGRIHNTFPDSIYSCFKLFTTEKIKPVKLESPIKGFGEKYIFKIVDSTAIIINEFDESQYATKNQIYKIRNEYAINLHVADTHREGPQHVKRHIRRPKYPPQIPLGAQLGENAFYKIMTLENELGDTLTAFIYDPNNVDDSSSIDYFLYEKDKPDNFDSQFNYYGNAPYLVDTIKKFKFYDISTSHDHIIE